MFGNPIRHNIGSIFCQKNDSTGEFIFFCWKTFFNNNTFAKRSNFRKIKANSISRFYSTATKKLNKLLSANIWFTRTESVGVSFYLHWLTVDQQIHFKILTTVFKCIHCLAPTPLSVILSSPLLEILLDSSQFYPSSSFGKRAFSYSAPRCWNALPRHLRVIPCLDTFKAHLKHHLFTNYSSYLHALHPTLDIMFPYFSNWYHVSLLSKLSQKYEENVQATLLNPLAFYENYSF